MTDSREFHMMLAGKDVDPCTGALIDGSGCSVNPLPYPVSCGTRVSAANPSHRCKVFFYVPETPPELIHTYCYQNESNWTTFKSEFSSIEWSDYPFITPENGYIRVVLDSAEKGYFTEAVSLELPENAEKPVPEWMRKQIDSLSGRVSEKRREGDLSLMILTDTHFAVGGIWDDTLKSLRLAAETVRPDAVVHLGDFTDGLLSGEQTDLLVRSMLENLKSLCGTLFCCVGNHDYNYFRGNPERFTRERCVELYLGKKNPWYYRDQKNQKLRLIFLDSFDPTERERYGFPKEELPWLERILNSVPKGWKVLIFSHVPPAAEIHVWSKTIRNGETMLKIAERFHKRRDGAVLGWIHGHNHADHVYLKRAFPIIGIGCSKLEDFREHKPEGSLTWDRVRGTESQELWDVLLVHPGKNNMDFLRFGAGVDRHAEMKKTL